MMPGRFTYLGGKSQEQSVYQSTLMGVYGPTDKEAPITDKVGRRIVGREETANYLARVRENPEPGQSTRESRFGGRHNMSGSSEYSSGDTPTPPRRKRHHARDHSPIGQMEKSRRGQKRTHGTGRFRGE